MCQKLFNEVNPYMNYQRLSMLKKFIGPSILVFAGAYMLHLSWFKWPDLLIDYGRELYVPWQITQGNVLYADLNHLYGPLAHYLNAFLFQIFGTGLSTLVYFNICLVILLAFLIYDLFKSTFGDFIATIAGLCFLVIFAFSQYVGIANYNFICPYSHEITYGVFLFFLALFIFRKYLLKPDWRFAALIGFLIGLIYLTKVEIFIASFITFLTGFIFIFWKIRPPHFRKHLFNLIFFFFIPIAAFFIYFSFHMPLINALDSIIASYKSLFMGALINNIFYLRISGFDDPLKNIAIMFKQAGGYLILLIFTIMISYLYTRLKNNAFKYGWILTVFALVFVIIFLGIFRVNWLEIARPYPIFLIVLLILLMVQLVLKSGNKTFPLKFLPFALLTLYSFLLLLKMILNIHLYHYGFALAMPASLVMVAILMYYIPAFVSRWGNKSVAAGFMGLFIFLALLFYFNFTKQIYALKNYPVAQGRDRFLTFDPRVSNRGSIMNETLKYIDKLMSKKDTFIVLPEGVMINYLSRKSNPSRYFEFTPNFVEAIGEEKILDVISPAHPSFIILSEKDTSEHGAQYFGKNYALNIYSWIVNNYTKVLRIGAEPLTGNGFGIIIAKKKK
jgi:hypothetical protein